MLGIIYTLNIMKSTAFICSYMDCHATLLTRHESWNHRKSAKIVEHAGLGLDTLDNVWYSRKVRLTIRVPYPFVSYAPERSSTINRGHFRLKDNVKEPPLFTSNDFH